VQLLQRAGGIVSFAEAADAGSFSAAARRLGISAAAVSKNIASLEEVLGVRLMNRTTRTLSLTEEGALFLQQARKVLEVVNDAAEIMATSKNPVAGHVRISTSAAFGRDFFLPLLPELKIKYPGLTLETDFDDRRIDFVQQGYDLAIRGGTITDSSLISRPVCQLNRVLVASPDYLERYGIPQHPDDLRRHSLIARRFLGGKVSSWEFRLNNGGRITVVPQPAELTLSAPETLADAASMGLGIAETGIHHALNYLKKGQLKALLLGMHDPGDYTMTLQYPHRALIAPRVKVTAEFLLSRFEQTEALHFPVSGLWDFRAE